MNIYDLSVLICNCLKNINNGVYVNYNFQLIRNQKDG